MTAARWTDETEWIVRMTGVSGPQARRILTALADAGVLIFREDLPESRGPETFKSFWQVILPEDLPQDRPVAGGRP